MNRRTLIIIGISAGVVLLLIAGYFIVSGLLRQEEPAEEVVLTAEERSQLTLSEEERRAGLTLEDKEQQLVEEKQQELESGEEPEEVNVVQIKKIIDERVEFPVFSADKQRLLFFNPQAREFYRTNLDGTGETAITNASFENLYDVSWSPDRERTVLTFSQDEGKTRSYSFFNIAEQNSVDYDPQYQEATISFDGQKVAYVYRDAQRKENNLSVANPDLSGWRKVRPTSEDTIILDWFSERYLATYTPPSAYIAGSLALYNVAEGGEYFGLLSQRWGLSPNFSPDGRKVLYNDNGIKNARFPVLWVSDIESGSVPKQLQLSTLVEKCTWGIDSTTVYCGVPDNYSNFYIQPDDSYSGKFISQDSFYKINTETGEQIKLADASQFAQDYDVYSPIVSDDGKNIYFIRKHDGKYYVLIMP